MAKSELRGALLRTKLFPPPARERWLPRERLVQVLRDAATRPLTLVSAGAGFGKTSLVSAWLAGEGVAAAWLSLDDADNDAARFWSYVCAALAGAVPETLDELAEASRSHAPPDTDELVNTLINALSEHPEPVALVLDDLHLIRAHEIHDALVHLIDHCPPSLRLVVTTRADPPWPLSRWRGRDRMAELRARELRFTAAETAALMGDALGDRVGHDECAALQARTEGWITGLHMAVLSLRATQDVRGFVAAFSGSHRFVLDYLADEVLAIQDAETRDFLMRTAIFERFSAELCDAVLERGASARIIAALEANNLFIIPLDERRQWYRYHHLFGEYLAARLAGEPIERRALHQRASQWFERRGLMEEAIDHALESADHERAADLLEQVCEARFTVQRQVRTLGWLARLPEHVTSKRPPLCSFQIWASFVTGEHARARALLDQAERALDTLALGPNERRAVSAQYRAFGAWLACDAGELERCVALASQALDELGEREPSTASLARLALACARLHLGEHDAARQACQRVLADDPLGREPVNAQVALAIAAHAELRDGQLDQVEAHYHEAMRRVASERGPTHMAGGMIRVSMAEVLRARGQWQRAETLVRAAIEQCEQQMGQPEHVYTGRVVLARTLLAQGQRDAAELALAEAEALRRRILTRRPGFERILATALGMRARLVAELEQAESPAESPADKPAESPAESPASDPAPRAENPAPPRAAPPAGAAPLIEELNEREARILKLMDAGLSNAEIASELFLSVHTVKWHARNLYTKLDVRSRTQAMARARELGLL